MTDGLEANYIALAACILSDKSPEVVLRNIFPEFSSINYRKMVTGNHTASDEIVVQMIQMRKTMTYKQIGDYFGITAGAVYHRIKRHAMRG